MANTTAPTPTDQNLQFILSVKVWIPASKKSEFFSLFKPVYDACVAEEECLFFVVGEPEDAGDGNISISWTEGWTKPVEWFMTVQMKRDYYEPYISTTEAIFTKPRWFEILKPKDGYTAFKLQSQSQ
ncbi:hypothetical protein ABEF93_006746 [Exophiala dermatitidis]